MHGFRIRCCWKQGMMYLGQESREMGFPQPAKPMLLVSRLFAPGPNPALWSLVGILKMSLVDTESSYCVRKHHWGELSSSQRAARCLFCILGTLPAKSWGPILWVLHAPCANGASPGTHCIQAGRKAGVEAPVIIPLGANLFLNWTVLFWYFSKTVMNQHPLPHFS